MLEIKDTVTEMKNVFNWLINTLCTAQERISEPEEMSVETFKTEMQREKRMKRHNKISKDWGKLQNV